MRRGTIESAAKLRDAALAGRATAAAALELTAYWSGALNVYEEGGEVRSPTLAAAQALMAEGVAAIWQVAAALLRRDQPGAAAAAERLTSLAGARQFLESSPDPAGYWSALTSGGEV